MGLPDTMCPADDARSFGWKKLARSKWLRGSLGSHLRALSSNDCGSAMIEFAVTVPFFILLVLGIGDLGQGLSRQFLLSQAAHRTLEMAQLGTGNDDYAYLVPEAASAANVPQSSVTLDKWTECNGTRTDYAAQCPTGEQTARYLQLRIQSSFMPLFGTSIFRNVQADGAVPINAQAALRVQ